MALQKTITLEDNFGINQTFLNAYIKVSKVSGDKQGVSATVAYLNQKGGRTLKTKQFVFTPSMDGDNFIRQAYEYIKTLDEFTGALDV